MFKNLYTLVTKVSLSVFVLSIVGNNFVNAQQWQNVGLSTNVSAGDSEINKVNVTNIVGQSLKIHLF